MEAPFRKILDRAHCREPALFETGPKGDHLINAFAIPALGQPKILFSKGLLGVMEVRETAAFFAHEVAHLEQFQEHKWRNPVTYLFATLSILGILLWLGRDSPWIDALAVAWLLMMHIANQRRVARMRKNETAGAEGRGERVLAIG